MSVGDNMSKIMILGAGGHGKVVAEIAKLMNKWDEIVFLDDNKSLHEVNSYKVIGTLSDYLIYKDRYQYAFVAIGDNKLRLKLIKNMMKNGISIPILRHPFTSISDNCKIGQGTVIMAGSIINTNSIIGKGCIINTSSSIDHDCILEDGVHVSPGVHIGGTVHIGKFSWICIGSSIINNITVGNNVVVASGSTVTKNVPDNVMIAGVPALIKKCLE
ncbi:acetyltransferase [Sporanaerobacter sp. PP17-6a]|uniref:acetyltransferase n=1 Tax=Sporanaerobacter sp. PP17-6a TaxID=1891289 RepID=UPI001F280679|nr:acetyltransferase [Sporanaerobacter sp. PP17-6a]